MKLLFSDSEDNDDIDEEVSVDMGAEKKKESAIISAKVKSNVKGLEIKESKLKKLQEVRDLLTLKEGLWKCKKCERSFKTKGNAYSHAEIHVSGLSYPC